MANSEFPEEIVTNILKRLPVKSLMRFQCVSPDWRVLIKSPFFRNMHIKHHKNGSSRNKEDEVEYILVLSSPETGDGNVRFSTYTRGHGGKLVPKQAPITFPAFPHSKLELCAPCNGIFCAVAKIDEDEPSIYLCNPATHEYRRLPDRPFGFQPNKFPRSGVSYVERAAWGFGLNPMTDDLKFVSVMYYGTPGDRYYFDATHDLFDVFISGYPGGVMPHGIFQFEVYELNSNTWREVDVVLPDCFGLVRRKRDESYVYSLDQWRGGGVFLNGSIHWLYGCDILCFDLSSEVIHIFSMRDGGELTRSLRSQFSGLVVLGGSLAVVDQTQRKRSYPISIWVMEEYGVQKSWVKRYRLASYPVPLYPLHSWKDDEGDLMLFQSADPNRIETLVSCSCSGGGYHAYPFRAMAKRFLVLRAIVISGLTLASVGSTV